MTKKVLLYYILGYLNSQKNSRNTESLELSYVLRLIEKYTRISNKNNSNE
ncbi:hypothetical protein SAMN05660866_03424 [Maribacter arcticus]|uniref:Uncharacterized protein n=1 Tax=Maribacter arcticus TaxID=561365 RepID=A0A1T5ECY3_9FLAO|nr:hypothetical protein SAMN05660866_03424 [Maribacter arcticus]